MATAAPPAPPAPAAPISGKELSKLLKLLEGADSTELKLTAPESQQRSYVRALGLDPLDAEIRQVFFFDTPDLTLDQHGVVVRARRVQKGDDSVVKLRPVVPANIPPELRREPSFGIEVDAMPGGFVCSASLKGSPRAGDVLAAVHGERPIRKVFSKLQREFFRQHAPEGVTLDDLSVLGPVNVLKLKYVPKDFGRKLTVEMWLYPDGTRLLELSTKCPPKDAFQAAAEARAFLGEKGIIVGGEQQTKTRTALNFFAAELKAAAEEPVVTT